MKEYKVLKLNNVTEFESDEEKVKSLTERGYLIVNEVNAVSTADARIKYEESIKRSEKQDKASDPSGYLNVISSIFLILSLIGCLAVIFDGSKYSTIVGASWLVMALLIHSACRCLIYITKKQAES